MPFAKVFDQYMTVRKAHVERILDAGNRGGDASRDMNVVAEYTMYAFFWVMCESSSPEPIDFLVRDVLTEHQ